MKISANDAAYIQNFKRKKNIWATHLYNWELTHCEANGLLMTGKFKISAKILLFPLVVVLGFFCCLFDGGLKEYPIAVREVFSDPMGAREYPNNYDGSRYARMKKIYDEKED